jgi:hypothetical protein
MAIGLAVSAAGMVRLELWEVLQEDTLGGPRDRLGHQELRGLALVHRPKLAVLNISARIVVKTNGAPRTGRRHLCQA